MKLYEVTNGYIGNGNVNCLIIADTETRALQLASKQFKKEIDDDLEETKKEYEKDTIKYGKKFADNFHKPFKCRYSKSYYTDLVAECLCDDTEKEWSYGPND